MGQKTAIIPSIIKIYKEIGKVKEKETLEYLIPRMTKEYLYRKDVLLVEKNGDFNST